ncbi:hypothetical protein BLOT_004634 [Blomia tropicalis]|nr:hypothetical protein BLOT_004634 [Blomia tropicalis]
MFWMLIVIRYVGGFRRVRHIHKINIPRGQTLRLLEPIPYYHLVDYPKTTIKVFTSYFNKKLFDVDKINFYQETHTDLFVIESCRPAKN